MHQVLPGQRSTNSYCKERQGNLLEKRSVNTGPRYQGRLRSCQTAQKQRIENHRPRNRLERLGKSERKYPGSKECEISRKEMCRKNDTII